MTNPTFCFVCFGPMPEHAFGRPRRWCSDACKQKAYRIRREALGDTLASLKSIAAYAGQPRLQRMLDELTGPLDDGAAETE